MARDRAKTGFYLPGWALFTILIVGSLNCLIFISIVMAYWRPDAVPVPITGDVVVGLHLQLFEAFLAALAIGLAVFGFVGYAALREAVERRVDDTMKTVMQAYSMRSQPEDPREQVSQAPDLEGLPATSAKPKLESDI